MMPSQVIYLLTLWRGCLGFTKIILCGKLISIALCALYVGRGTPGRLRMESNLCKRLGLVFEIFAYCTSIGPIGGMPCISIVDFLDHISVRM